MPQLMICIACGGPTRKRGAMRCRRCEDTRRHRPDYHPVNYRGRWMSKGYWWVTLEKDGEFTVRQEHIVVWEAAHGPLPPGCAVHHINEDKLDNRLENLQLLPRGEYLSRHVRGKPKPWCRYRPHDPLTGKFTR
jgi:hypothetical protein